jgi:glycosyltransferase involved in cell wall biosynthesis
MKISIITPNRNGERFLNQTLSSVLLQRQSGIDMEYIVIDGASDDRSMEIINRYKDQIDYIVSEPDNGPASAINKGIALASGDIVAWLNADDVYSSNALQRVLSTMESNPHRALGFGRCRIIDESGKEIRRSITKFKELFRPVSCRGMIQTINYISQPSTFFRRTAIDKVGPLRENLKAAFDYDFILRLWQHGGACRIPGPALANFRWYESSISGQHFREQFAEEYNIAAKDAGRLSPQAILHKGVQAGIVGIYTLMQSQRGRHRRPHNASGR